jgi:hypothetical protein
MWTEYGWTWESYEPFGWITYHYGFWAYDNVWGWVWIPGYEWYPARVLWATFDDYIAWAPIPPPGYADWGDPWAVDDIYAWHVVGDEHFVDTDLQPRQQSFKERYRVKNRSTVRYKPPDVSRVERELRRTLRPVSVELAELRVRGRTIRRIKPSKDEDVIRLRELTAEKIRLPGEMYPDYQTNVPYQDDRVAPAREERQREQEPDTRGREQREKPREKKKDDPGKPKKQEPDRREPEKKQPEKRPEKKQPEKRPEKKQPKKEPEKKDDKTGDKPKKKPEKPKKRKG